MFDITSSDLENSKTFPHAAEVKGRRIEVIQSQGQVIFVPSGWHHQVINLVRFSFKEFKIKFLIKLEIKLKHHLFALVIHSHYHQDFKKK